MDGYRCQYCNTWWATMARAHDNYRLITVLCPDCVATLPAADDNQLDVGALRLRTA